MFSDSRAPEPGDQRGFKPHASHFFPWLRNGLKPQHSSDLGLDGPYKCSTEPRNNLTPRGRAKGIGFFSKELIQGKDREKRGELRCNGVGLARRLPVVLRGHHILPESLGKQREDSPARWSQSPELDPDSDTGTNPGDRPQGLCNSSTSVQDYYSECSFVRNHRSHLNLLHSHGTSTPVKHGPLLAPAPVPASAAPGKFKGQEPNCKVPVVVCTEDGRGKLWRYARHTYQRDLHSSSWLSSDTQGLIDRQQGFSSSFSYITEQSRNSQSQRDLTGLREPPVEVFNGPSTLHGVIFSTAVPQRGLGCTKTLRGPRKPRPSSERIAIGGRNQTWVQPRPTGEGEPQSCRKEAGHSGPRCSRKAVRNQIKRVVDNLEQVLGALKDVQQEMKEVVEQIDYLTSSIDLNEEEQEVGGGGRGGGGDGTKPPSDSSSSSSSSSSGVTVGSNHQRPSEQEDKPGSTDPSGTLRSARCVTPHTQTTGLSSGKIQTLQFTCNLGSSPKQGRPPPYTHNPPSSASSVKTGSPPQPQSLTSHDFASSPQRSSSLPVRPPTPGLSPLTVNLPHPSSTPEASPGSQPHSPGPSSPIGVGPVSPPCPLSPKPPPPPALSPSVIIETRVGSYLTPQSDHPSVSPLSPSSPQPPSASCPPRDSEPQTLSKTDGERQGSSAGIVHPPSQDCTTPADTTKTPTSQGRRGRKPPPYPHNRVFERMKKAKEPRKAPPYPEKRLLSTTV